MILAGLKRTFTLTLYNARSKKTTEKKVKGETRMMALAYLLEKTKHPENYTLLDVTSVV